MDAAVVLFQDNAQPHVASSPPVQTDARRPGAQPTPAQVPPALDYSTGVFLLDGEGRVVAEHNGPPGDAPTTAWAVGDMVYDRHTLALPGDLPPGTYRVMVNAYWYGDLEPLRVNGEAAAVVGQVTVRER